MASTTLRSPVVRTAVSAIQKLYPVALADKSWDNTGLLLEVPPLPSTCPVSSAPRRNTILLTIDLTRAVCSEAIRLNASLILTYHPIIFRGLKSLTLSDPQQETILRLAQHGISVYSPHTAVDAAVGGVNDWLLDGIVSGDKVESQRVIDVVDIGEEAFEGSGMGRVVVLGKGVGLKDLVERAKKLVGMEKGEIHLALLFAPQYIKSIAICAGSGGSLFRNVQADLYFTGELSHHEALSAREKGSSIITCFHSNTERGFLESVMKGKLQKVLDEEWENVKEEEKEGKDGFEVVVSKEDADPYVIV
ncbi:NGG1p interacting factor 3 [Ascodesmis nigricans]|uniref:NGG1p interacting factor 3 n=1 Tax=Ascodesmis nigricans TaxID=341454 RepID=A0A4S2N3Q4_9PEZI|nr:NGG1p interacting factor 3 [Ascodesmis nigricans]